MTERAKNRTYSKPRLISNVTLRDEIKNKRKKTLVAAILKILFATYSMCFFKTHVEAQLEALGVARPTQQRQQEQEQGERQQAGRHATGRQRQGSKRGTGEGVSVGGEAPAQGAGY